MATNLVTLDVYQINQHPLISTAGVSAGVSQSLSFPTQGFMVRDTTNSPTRSLPTGYNVYAALQGPDGTLYYVRQTQAQVVSLFNA